jgi:hypothetical protein
MLAQQDEERPGPAAYDPQLPATSTNISEGTRFGLCFCLVVRMPVFLDTSSVHDELTSDSDSVSSSGAYSFRFTR